MIKSILRRIRSVFRSDSNHIDVNGIETLVLFDGDNVSRVAKLMSKYVDDNTSRSHCRNVWATVTTIPNVISKNLSIETYQPHNVAKDSVDFYIAMMAVHECATNKSIKEVRIVSSDGDLTFVVLTMANMFPHIKFRQIIPAGMMSSKARDVICANQTKNISFENIS